jgi:hypothetical protein
MQLRLDHLIIRTPDPAATLGLMAERLAAPVLAPVEDFSGMTGGIVRADPVDIEVLAIGRPPARPHGYGIGLVADAPLREVSRALCSLGFATSATLRARAGPPGDRRTWDAIQVHGLLPDPFPVPTSRRPPGTGERVMTAAGAALARVPALARLATRDAGASMVVVTEYGFDAERWRLAAGPGPRVLAVELGTAGRREAWRRLPLARGPSLRLRDDGAPGLTRIVLAGGRGGRREDFAIGDVEVVYE